ncbi:MAG: type II secretion system major pseudopilin GspG [Candidatus Sumerlaeota bacterium]|nr:type II secretion system major pseudopilin GspG [Candidatus Sumerlaeota bacterium]
MRLMMRVEKRAALYRSRRSGFTFMEIMIVVVIIGILASIVTPAIIHHLDEAAIAATKLEMENVKTALHNYCMKVGDYPTTAQGLAALRSCPLGVDPVKWGKYYMEKTPKDGWKHDYIYRCPGTHDLDFDLVSIGKDGQEGTADDIVNWETPEENKK